ncbi:hypothetical protein MD484_g8732, partial [Candolleomyces efflorescens]
MARTKRAAQTSALPTPSESPVYVPDDYEVVDSSPPSPTPGQRSGATKRKPRGSTDSSPVKKKPKASVANSDDEDGSVSDSGTLNSSTAAGGTPEVVEVDELEDDLETPKASKINPKGKGKPNRSGGNLKTALGGTIGVDAGDVDRPAADSALNTSLIVTIPSSAFTLENKDQWADSCVEQTKTYLFVKARSSDDPLLLNKSLLDPYLNKRGYYKNLPKANSLHLVSTRKSASFTNGSLTSTVPGLSMDTWDVFSINREYIASLLRFKRQGVYVNPSTVDVVDLVFRESYSTQGPGNAFLACTKDTSRPAIFVSLGGIMSSFISEGKNIGFEGRGPFTKGVVIVEHRLEYERMSCLLATLWQAEEIIAPIQNRHITFQTMNRRNNPDETDVPFASDASVSKVGKMNITHYSSPSKRYAPKNKTSLDFNDEIPVYDGRNEAFDCSNIASSLSSLPPYSLSAEDGHEIPEGTGGLVGYTVSTSRYLSNWRLTFHVLWIVVIAD